MPKPGYLKSKLLRNLLNSVLFILIYLMNNLIVMAESSNTIASEAILWENSETGYHVAIEDDAGLLNDEEKSLLLTKMQEITAYGNAVFKSIDYNIYSTSSFASSYYHELFGSNSGTLFLIDMDNREIYLFSDGAIYRTITSSYADTITDNVYRYASHEDYCTCASKAFEQVYSLLSGQKIAQPMKYISNLLLALILAALINYFLVRLLSVSSKPGSGEILGAISPRFVFTDPKKIKTSQTKVYSPPSNSSGDSGSHSGGGGGGHSSSGGGGGHRF